MAEVVSHVLNPAARFQQMHGHGVAQRMNRSFLDAGCRGVVGEELLHLALLQGALAAGEEVRPPNPFFKRRIVIR